MPNGEAFPELLMSEEARDWLEFYQQELAKIEGMKIKILIFTKGEGYKDEKRT